jgi:peptide/nickel transport system ATP-binding protein
MVLPIAPKPPRGALPDGARYDGPILEIDGPNLEIDLLLHAAARDPGGDGFLLHRCMPGEAMGLVGESGCGKSTVALGVMQDLGVNGRDRRRLDQVQGPRPQRHVRRGAARHPRLEIAMIYQEPMASLNPAMKIGKQLMEVPMIHEGVGAKKPTSARSRW